MKKIGDRYNFSGIVRMSKSLWLPIFCFLPLAKHSSPINSLVLLAATSLSFSFAMERAHHVPSTIIEDFFKDPQERSEFSLLRLLPELKNQIGKFVLTEPIIAWLATRHMEITARKFIDPANANANYILSTAVLSPSGQKFASFGFGGMLFSCSEALYEVQTGECTHLPGVDVPFLLAVFDKSEKKVAALSTHRSLIRIWEVSTHRVIVSLETPADALLFDESGDRLFTYCLPPRNEGFIKIWNVQTGRLIQEIGDGKLVGRPCFNKNSTRMVSATSQGTAIIWDLGTYQPIRRVDGLEGRPLSAEFLESKYLMIVSQEKVQIWNIQTKVLLSSFRNLNYLSVTPHPAGLELMVQAAQGQWYLWKNEIVELPGLPKETERVFYSKDGKLAISAAAESGAIGNYEAYLWNAVSGKLLYKFHGIKTISFDDEGTGILTATKDGKVTVWDVRMFTYFRTARLSLEQLLLLHVLYELSIVSEMRANRKSLMEAFFDSFESKFQEIPSYLQEKMAELMKTEQLFKSFFFREAVTLDLVQYAHLRGIYLSLPAWIRSVTDPYVDMGGEHPAKKVKRDEKFPS